MTLHLNRLAQKSNKYISTEIKFLPNSLEEPRYNEYVNDDHRHILKMSGHIPNTMSYRLNNYGFRGEDFTVGSDCDVAIGSSNTWGGGTHEEFIFPTLIAQRTNRTVYNLGFPAGTSDGTFRYCEYWLPKLKPKNVYACWPSPARSELVVDHDGRKHIIHLAKSETKWKKLLNKWPANGKWFTKWFANMENSYLNNLKNLYAVKYICEQIGANLIVARPDVITYDNLPEELKILPTFNIQRGAWPISDIGRDFKHPGPVWHSMFADYRLENNDFDVIVKELNEKTFK